MIVNISSAGGIRYLFAVPYGVGKAAVDRMAADMAFELKKYGVTCISLWPGMVHTELVEANKEPFSHASGMNVETFNQILEAAETPEFVGKAVVALAKDPNRINKTGKILLTADLASEYKFTDNNGALGKSICLIIFLFIQDWFHPTCAASVRLYSSWDGLTWLNFSLDSSKRPNYFYIWPPTNFDWKGMICMTFINKRLCPIDGK
jgi:hypothetical protein